MDVTSTFSVLIATAKETAAPPVEAVPATIVMGVCATPATGGGVIETDPERVIVTVNGCPLIVTTELPKTVPRAAATPFGVRTPYLAFALAVTMQLKKSHRLGTD
jgi:uncharacterized membrane protein